MSNSRKRAAAMAGDDGQQAMTSERLAKLRARAEHLAEVREVGPHDFSDLEHKQLCSIAMAYHEDIPALLAEVERQRAREAALLAVVRAVADGIVMELNNSQTGEVVGDGLFLPLQEYLKAQARALLASAAEAEAGEQAAQGEACELCGGSGRYVRAIAYEDADGTVREGVSNILCHGCNGTGKRQSRRASSAVNAVNSDQSERSGERDDGKPL